MLTKIVLAAAVVLGTGSFALAAQSDGDNNPVPGVQRHVPGSLSAAFASARVPVQRTRSIALTSERERDGDGNRIPGAR